jgi:hypothetical protein
MRSCPCKKPLTIIANWLRLFCYCSPPSRQGNHSPSPNSTPDVDVRQHLAEIAHVELCPADRTIALVPPVFGETVGVDAAIFLKLP